jgi:adenosine deaminase
MSPTALPTIELHRHLEGSLRIQSLIELAQIHKVPLPTEDPRELAQVAQVLEPMDGLDAVLAAFGLFQNAFRSLPAVERLAYEAVVDAALDGVRILELRFSPGFMAQPSGLDWDAMMDAILTGVGRAEQEHDIAVGLIAIVSRIYGPDSARETAAFAANWRDALVGFDLADVEEQWPARAFSEAIEPVHKTGLPVTVHSGENTGPEHIRDSLDWLQAQRIGHGVSLIQDEGLMRRCADESILIEACPTSNVRTRAVPSLEAHPARALLRAGVPVSINSDDPGLFDITLSGELRLAETHMGFSEADIRATIQCAYRGSFVPSATKEQALADTPAWDFISLG